MDTWKKTPSDIPLLKTAKEKHHQMKIKKSVNENTETLPCNVLRKLNIFVFFVPLHCDHTIFTCNCFRKVMVRVDAKQGAPKDGNSTIELLQVIVLLFF